MNLKYYDSMSVVFLATVLLCLSGINYTVQKGKEKKVYGILVFLCCFIILFYAIQPKLPFKISKIYLFP